MPTHLARFTSNCVDLSHKSVVGEPQPQLQKGDGGYADWVIVAIHCLREYLNQPSRRLLDILHEMPRITAKLGLSVDELPDFTTVCTRKQDVESHASKQGPIVVLIGGYTNRFPRESEELSIRT